jgi:hypothetical protein
VKINVQGAFIVDEEQPGTPQSEDYEHDPKDIRLPNHTAVVSHIAVDVSIHGVACSFWDMRQPLSIMSRRIATSRSNANERLAYRSEGLLRNSSTSPVNMATTPSVAD